MVKGLLSDENEQIRQMGCKDGPVYSTITCTFNFQGAHASLVKNLLVKGREREKQREWEKKST